MVSSPTINPQVYSKRGGGVPRLTAQPQTSLRNVPSVSAFAQGSITDTLVNMADDAKRLQMIQSKQFEMAQGSFDNALADIKEHQAIEAEGIYADASIEVTTGIKAVRENTTDYNDIPKATMGAYDEIVARRLEDSNLSDFQRDILNKQFERDKVRVAQDALKYQAELRNIERNNNIAKSVQASQLRVVNNPSSRLDEIEIHKEKLQTMGLRGPELDARMREFGLATTKLAIQAGLEKNYAQTVRSMNSGAFDDYLDGATKITMLSAIEREQNSREAEFEDISNKARKRRAEGVQKQILMATDTSVPFEERPKPPTRQQIVDLNLGVSHTSTLIALLEDNGVDDPSFLADLNNVRREQGPTAARELLEDGVRAGKISKNTFSAEDATLEQDERRQGAVPLLENSMRLIESMQNETTLNKFPTLSINVQQAKDELRLRVQEFDDSKPDASMSERNEFIRRERTSVLQENFPRALFNIRTQIPTPYGFTGGSINVNQETVEKAEQRIAQDLRDGKISKSRAIREAQKVERWIEQLAVEGQVNGAINER